MNAVVFHDVGDIRVGAIPKPKSPQPKSPEPKTTPAPTIPTPKTLEPAGNNVHALHVLTINMHKGFTFSKNCRN